MSSYVTPKINTEFIFYVGLFSQANTKVLQSNPTLASGDVRVSIDGGAFANLTTLPTVTPASGKAVKVTLSASEMNGDNITLIFSDATGDEWCDLVVSIQTTTQQFDDLALASDMAIGFTESLLGVVLSSGKIGSTGNDTTHIHLEDLDQADDELNDYLLVIYDNSGGDYYSRWIEDWVNSSGLATVATLPITPQGAIDNYWLHAVRRSLTASQINVEVDTALADYDAPTKAELDTAQASIEADIATMQGNVTDILADTGTTIPAQIAGLNNLSAADVNAQVDTALSDYDAPTYNELLDLIRILARKDSAIASDLTSLLASLNADLGSGAGAYSNTTDSIEAIRDRGDSAWVTAAGTSTLTQADIRTAVGLASANLDTQLDALPTAAEIRAEIDTNSTELAQIITDIAVVDSTVDAILVDTGTDIPARFDGVEGATFNTATDSLEAIRDRGDAAWATGTTPATAAAIADAVWDEARAGHTTSGTFGEGVASVQGNVTGSVDSVTQEVSATITAIDGDNGAASVLAAWLSVGESDSAAAGSSSTITLGATGSATNDIYDGRMIVIWAGAGVGQARIISDYVGSSKVATVSEDWITAPDNTSSYVVVPLNLNSDPTGLTTLLTRLGTPSNLGSGATVAANLVDIEAQTDDIGAAGAGLNAIPWNSAWDTEVQSEVQDAIEANHLDHLLAVTYDPANKPGVSTALLNELIESDSGVSRYTANALENAPSGGSGGATAAQVWAYGNRTLTSAVTSVETTVSSTEVSMYRGDTFSASMTGLGALGTWSKVYLTVKRDDVRDTESLVQLLVTNPAAAGDGLQRLNGRTATAAWGSLTIDDDSAGDITIALSANATKALEPGDYLFDIKYINSTGSHIKASGTWIVNQDVTRAIA